MNTAQAKQIAREWVAANVAQWPGLRAAHLVGGITAMPDEAAFPAHKDVDVHLIFDEGSPALRPTGQFINILEDSYRGVSIEAGVKSVAEYHSAAAVLANPEIAYHLTVDSLLYDVDGLLGDLQEPVRSEYARREWVLARLDHERKGFAGALGMLPMARVRFGASGEANLLGYATTFFTAVLQVAALNPPKMGGRVFLRMRESLAAYDRLDLYEEILALLGFEGIGPALVERFLREATEAFDLAIEVKRTKYPFEHKLHRHLRPYFVETCRGMLDEGYHREALGWILPYHLATSDVLLADGPEAEKPLIAERQAAFLRTIGMDTDEARATKVVQANRLSERVFALANEIVAGHPGVVD